MIESMFESAPVECDTDIIFRTDGQGARNNPCQKLFESYVKHPSLANGLKIAERLQGVTTHRSGLGLLFLMVGKDSAGPRLVVARFPAESGFLANPEGASKLTVEFIDRVFMKSARAYKCVTYVARPGFLDGRAVDKQINDVREISGYWINEFLESDFRTTGAGGSARLGEALRKATNITQGGIRSELVAAAQVIRNQHGRTTSAAKIATDLNLTPEATEALRSSLPRQSLFHERFKFSRDEYDKHVALRSVELDNGGTLIADNNEFDTIFRREVVRGDGHRRRFTTEGAIVSERLRKTS